MMGPDASRFWPLPFAPLAELLDYWQAKRGGRAAPDKDDIDPIDLPRLLPDIALLDAAPPGGEFRYRLAGSRAVAMLGREPRGLTQRDLHGRPSDPKVLRVMARAEREFDWVARKLVGGFRTTALAMPDREHVEWARLVLPLSAGSGRARHLLMIMVSIAGSPHSVAAAGPVAFGIDLARMAPIGLPPEVAALSDEPVAVAIP